MLCIALQTYASDLIPDNADPSTYEVIKSASTGSQLSLEAIKSANGNINEIRLLLKGDKDECYRLLREAIAQDDAVIQIQLSYALVGIEWGDDKNRDFSSAVASDLEDYLYYPRGFYSFNEAYDDALSLEFDLHEHDKRGAETFKKASALGYLPAVIELLYIEWAGKTASSEFALAFALVLQPYVGKGDKYLDYDFGLALKNGSPNGSELYYEGMYWMEISLGNDVKYPRENESFEKFKSWYCTYKDLISMFDDYDGLRHLSSGVILAPSRQFWLDFKAAKLQNINPTVGQGLSIL